MTFDPYAFGQRDAADWPVTPGGPRNAYAALEMALTLMNWASAFIKPETLAFRHALAFDDENPELDEQLQDDLELLFKLACDLEMELEDTLNQLRRKGPGGKPAR